jgi:hypothetical protein
MCRPRPVRWKVGEASDARARRDYRISVQCRPVEVERPKLQRVILCADVIARMPSMHSLLAGHVVRSRKRDEVLVGRLPRAVD